MTDKIAPGGPFAGVELGGTKCVAILARGPHEVMARETVPTTSPQETLARLEAVLAGWASEHELAALGIASFGPVDLDPTSAAYGSITSTPKPGWAGTQVRSRLQQAARIRTAFDTDVNGAALAEMRWGAGQGFDDFAYVTVGTGVGVGLVVNGAPTRGFGHCELGHIRVARSPGDEWQGWCPYHGDCVEGLVSGPALQARLGSSDLRHISQEDPVWQPVVSALAQLCHVIVCAAAPRAIAISGGVVDGQKHLLPRIEATLIESLSGYVQLPEGAPYLRAPALGSDAGPLGAIALAMTARP